jgi:F0F1-type ATP synthase assembly protein I
MADDLPPPPPNQPGKKQGWIDNLAARSTGLPSDSPNSSSSPSSRDVSLWSLGGAGLQFAATVALMALVGWKLDGWMGWSPWGVVGMTFLGLVGGLYLLIKESGNRS